MKKPSPRTFLLPLLPALAFAQDAPPESTVSLGSMRIDIARPDAGVPERLRAVPAPPGAEEVAIVKFAAPASAAQLAELRESVGRVYCYLPHDAYLVRVRSDRAADVAARTGAVFLGPYHPAYKLSPRVSVVTPPASGRPLVVMVHVLPDADLHAVSRQVRDLGVTGLVGAGRAHRFSRLRFLMTPAELERIREDVARMPEVFWIDVEPRLALLNDTTIWVGQSGVGGGQTTPIFSRNIYGQGQVVGIIDTGLDADMCWFYDSARGLPPTNACNAGTTVDAQQRKVLAVDFLWQNECSGGIGNGEWDTQDHGTHVAGTVGGDRGTPLTHDSGDGMAPGAKLVIQDAGYQVDNCGDLPGIGCPLVNMVPVFQQAYDQGARMYSNSYGDNENAGVQNNYTATSEDVDEFMWNHKDFLVFFAAGNSGPGNNTVGSPSTAKSCVSVGATLRGTSAESMASFSSCGYTDDSRYKPEITIPGSSIVSANNDGNVGTSNCGTQSSSGTSMACPAAAGLTALIRQYYADGFYPTGTATPGNAFAPSAALMRSTLVNSAQNMTGVGTPIPSRCQGWGRILLDNALYFPGDARRLFASDHAGFPTGSTGSVSFPINVLSGSVPFKATVGGTDYPSTPAASIHLVNDIDLTVTLPDGSTVYRGNVFSGGQSTTGGSADRRNTLEQVLLLAPVQTGTYTVTVTAFNIPQGTQPFGLVVTGDLNPCPVLTVNPATLPGGTVGAAYSQTISASGGASPYTFAVTAGSLPAGLALDGGTGALTGTPTAAGPSSFTVTATDAAACTGSRAYSPAMTCPSVTLSPASLPGGTVGTAYSQTISASGGTSPYTFAVTSGSLPLGLSLGSGGALTGTPTTTGTFGITVTATDAYGCTGATGYSIVVACPAITVSPTALPAGIVGAPYSQTITASGGSAPYTFAVTSGTLPAGLTLSSGGALTGTPTTPGTSNVTVTATDTFGCAGSRAYAIDVACPAIALSPASLPAGTVGAPYSQTISASGGTAPYTYAVTSGTLPAGLTLAAGGLLSGTPTTAATSSFTVTATDAFGCTGSLGYMLNINPPGCPAITLSPGSLPDGDEGIAYAQSVTASGGAPPYTYAVSSGALPPGLSLGAGTGAISGTPGAAGVFPFAITATDAAGCDGGAALSITIDVAVAHVLGEGLGPVNGNGVRVYTRAGAATAVSFAAYGSGQWGTNVSAGNVNGATYAEILTAPGPGDVYGPHVRAWQRDGTSLAKVSFFAYGTLKYGANVTGGELDGDAYDEMVTGPGPGAVFGPHVRGFDFDNATLQTIAKINFFAYGTLKYGVNVEEGSVDADAFAELLTGAGPGAVFAPTVKGWNHDGGPVAAIAKINFNAFAGTFGVNVAGGDADGDGFAEMAAARGPAPANPNAFAGFDYDGASVAPAPGFTVTPPPGSFHGGRVALGDLTGDGRWDLGCGLGRDPAAPSTVNVYAYTGTALVPLPPSFTPFTATGYAYGVNVGAGGLGYH